MYQIVDLTYNSTFCKHFPPAAVVLFSCFPPRGTREARRYIMADAWVPAELRGVCSGCLKPRKLALFHGFCVTPRRAAQDHGNTQLSVLWYKGMP